MRALVFAGMLGGLAACAGGSDALPAPVAPGVAKLQGPDFGAWEAKWLMELGATDPRLASRVPVKPSADVLGRIAGEAVVRGDTNVGVVGGAIDLFSFEDRGRQLRVLRAELAKAPEGATPALREEKVLLTRLLDGEELRLASERESPESASERVRAIVATWGHPSSAIEVDEREMLIQRGVRSVIGDVAAGLLQGPRVLELEDALDALERLAVPEGYPEATKIITSLRIELGKVHPAVARERPAPTFATELATYLGVRDDRDVLLAHLEAEEASLRSEAKGKLATMPEREAESALVEAAAHVDAEALCNTARSTSLVRRMPPPPERAFVCEALRLAGDANATRDVIIATVALHDDVAIAIWAIALAHGANDLDATRAAHPLLASVSPGVQDRLVRVALVSPIRAAAPGLAAVLLDEGGPSQRQERAIRWRAYGDAPFDLVADALSPTK